MSQLIGCYLQCGTSLVGQLATIEGPLFTVGKMSKNGDRIPPVEAERLKTSLIGSKIRYCPKGVAVDGVVAEHYCDLIKDKSSEIGEIQAIFSKTDAAGREIMYARGTLKPGVEPDSLPKSWSLFGQYKERDDDDNIFGLDDPSITVLDRPAFDEAVTQTYKITANGAPSDEKAPNLQNINKGTDNKEGEHMPEADKSITPAAPAATPATPQETPVAAPKEAPVETIKKADVEKLLADERKRIIEETKETMARENLAGTLADTKIRLNLAKAEDRDKVYESLMRYNSADLKTMITEYETIQKVAKERAKSEGIKGSDLAGATNPPTIPEALKSEKFNKILTKLGSSPEIFTKQMEAHRF